ncbi:hypothetical protein OAF61_02170 [Pseudomonadales bacterium]|nr:hypothetical protein [Pseudomonadales bacterium]
MINPLNELSSVYMQNIAEDCGKCSCDGKGCSKCDKKKAPEIKGSSSVDGGDEAKPGKDKNYVKPMATESKEGLMKAGREQYKKEKEEGRYGGTKPSNERVAKLMKKKVNEDKEESKIGGGNLKKLAAKANTRIDADVDGDVDTNDPKSTEMGEFVPSVDGKKKIKTKARFESAYSNWRSNSQELLEYISGSNGLGSGVNDDEKNLENPKAKTDTKSNQKITEKSVKNKIRINPPQGMAEAFNELGGVITEMYEIVEETEEEKKKREMLAKTKEHDDKKSGKLAEADMTGAPSIKDAKPAKKTNVKYDPHMKVMAPSVKEGVLSGALSTIRSKNGMGTVTAKGADKLQAKKEKTMGEENKMSAFDIVKKQIKDKYGEKSLIDTKAPKKQPSPEQRKADAQRRAKNYADNNKNYNPYKARAGESD